MRGWYYYIVGVDGWYEVIEAREDTDKMTAIGARFKYESAAAAYCALKNREAK